MKAILGAAKKPVQVWSAADIGFNAEAAWSEQQVAAPKHRERQRIVIEGDGEERIAAFAAKIFAKSFNYRGCYEHVFSSLGIRQLPLLVCRN